MKNEHKGALFQGFRAFIWQLGSGSATLVLATYPQLRKKQGEQLYN
jgi:hypothetical protein